MLLPDLYKQLANQGRITCMIDSFCFSPYALLGFTHGTTYLCGNDPHRVGHQHVATACE